MPDYDELGRRLPRVPMFDPLPPELMRNMPPWVHRLQKVAYWLMLPWGIMLFFMLSVFPVLRRFGVL